MRVVRLAHPTDFDGWRTAARTLRLADVEPAQVRWTVGEGDGALFDGEAGPETRPGATFTASRSFVNLAKVVICHADPGRFDLLYRLLWRLKDEPRLVEILTDPDVADALLMQRNVRQAEHKMHAFVRFRRVDDADDPATAEEYAAWYEPPHYVIALGVDFFVRRLANVKFTIVSPYVTASWDGTQMSFGPGGSKADTPSEDASEELWIDYFRNIFNPARLNPKVMTQHMAKHYWKNLPEAQSIPDLISAAQGRTDAMVEALPTVPSARALKAAVRSQRDEPFEAHTAVSTLEDVAAGVQVCRRCDLWRDATQGVPGEGPRAAKLMFVGEQPGDMEDLKGRPFIGPAGQLFNRALAEAGVPREETYVTNSVKHFKHELRGKRRLHAKPNAGEVTACNGWLTAERRIVKPRVIVALGATASSAVFRGQSYSVMRDRGSVGELDDGAVGFLTVHPSFLLRVQDEEAKAREYALFVRDLKAAWALVA
ncbi:UdgX family uracil-DNA binding protein [soil metagenome]